MAKLSSTQIYGDLQVDGEIKNKATIETEGVVQLNDAIDNTSTTQGATANAVKKVNDSLSSHKTDTTSHITASERTTWNGKAEASHGNHVPTTQTVNSSVFLRNDNTWQTVTPSNIGASPSNHTHSYLPLSGGIVTGAVNLANGTWNNVGDDVSIGDCNLAGRLGIKGLNGATGISFAPYSGTITQDITTDGVGNLTITGNTKGSFMGALSGNASTATKLQTARTINGVAFDGSSNITISASANGGNADTVDGSHAWQMQTLSSGGGCHGSSSWVAQIQHNKDGDGLFKLFVGDQSIGTKVDKSIDADTLKKRDICTEIDNLKSTVVNGKTSVANAINGKSGTSLSNQSSFDEMATAISNISKAPEAFSMGSVKITGTSPHPLGKYVESCFSMQTGKNGTVRIRLIPNQTSFNSLGIHVSSGTYSNIIFNQLIPNIALKDGFYEIEARFSGFVQMNLSCIYVSDTGKGITFSYCVFCD